MLTHAVIRGDVNQKDITALLTDHPDIRVLNTPTTRVAETLDLYLTNVPPDTTHVRKFPPLSATSGQPSDHDCVVCFVKQRRKHILTKKTFKYRPYSEDKAGAFGAELATVDWAPLYQLGVNRAVEAMNTILQELYHKHFPEKTQTIKSSDDLWVNGKIRRLAVKKQRHYRKRKKDWRWRQWRTRCKLRYDYNVVEKIRTTGARSHFTSAAATYEVKAFIVPDSESPPIISGERLKILGFVFGLTPDVFVHVREMISSFNSKL